MKYITVVLLLNIVCCFNSVAIDLSQIKQSDDKRLPFVISYDKEQIISHSSDQTSVYNRSDLQQTLRRRYWKNWLKIKLGLRKKMELQQIACSSHENLIAIVHDAKMIELSEYVDGKLKPVRTFHLKDTQANITSISFVGKGIKLAVGCDNGEVHSLYVSKDGKFRERKHVIAENDAVVSALSVSRSRDKLVALCKNGDTSEVKVIPIDKKDRDNRIGRSLSTSQLASKHYSCDESDIISLACSPKGKYFATVHQNGKVQVCKIGQNVQKLVAEWQSDEARSVTFDDAQHLLIGHIGTQGPLIETVDLAAVLGIKHCKHNE
ncbi:MAG TPA: hypothetical protein VI521_03235 [Candidatus Babeliales bacterium]|nr:hypothetical protein [Candidatus Babeliales bacterium]